MLCRLSSGATKGEAFDKLVDPTSLGAFLKTDNAHKLIKDHSEKLGILDQLRLFKAIITRLDLTDDSHAKAIGSLLIDAINSKLVKT